MLVFDTFGQPEAEPLLIAHGLYGSRRNWRGIAKQLAEKFFVVVVDMPNHGSSPFRDEMTYPTMASDLADVIDASCDGRPAHVLGHSMGGKAAMALALTEGKRVARLLVADIAPVGYSHSHAHIIDAMEAVPIHSIKRRSEARATLIERLEDPVLAAFLLQQLEADADGFRWCLNLPTLRAYLDTLLDFPTFSEPAQHSTLFLTGGTSDYVDSNGREAARAHFPNARFATLKGAGHWLHADAPAAFVETASAFFSAP